MAGAGLTLAVLGRLPDRQLVAARIDEVEAAPAGEGEDWLGDGAAGLGDRVEGGLQVINPNDR